MKIWVEDEYACPEWARKHANKLWHFLGSALLTVTLGILGKHSAGMSATYSMLAGIDWELADMLLGHGTSKLDLVADALGCCTGMGVLLIHYYLEIGLWVLW
jgi:hypothetical protein